MAVGHLWGGIRLRWFQDGSVSRGRADKLRPLPAVQGPGSAPLRPPHRELLGVPRPRGRLTALAVKAGVLHTWCPGAALTSQEPQKRVLVQNGSSFRVSGANASSPAGPRVPPRGLLRPHRAFYQTLAQLNHSLPSYFRATLAAFAWPELYTGEVGPFLPAKLPLSFIARTGLPVGTAPTQATS